VFILMIFDDIIQDNSFCRKSFFSHFRYPLL